MAKIFCFGLGYSAQTLAKDLKEQGWTVAGTCRTPGKCSHLRMNGIDAHVFDGAAALDAARSAMSGTTHLLISIPPNADGDPVLRHHAEDIHALAQAPGQSLKWVGYLSTTGVYGDTGGADVTETSPLNPTSPRSVLRAAAETGWLDLWRDHGVQVHVFRLAGIYGPGRSILDQVQAGAARRIDKPGHRFSRIHVDDIATVLLASMGRPNPGEIYNVCDDQAAAQSDVVAYACELLKVTPPPLMPFDDAAPTMSPMALSFWRDNRLVVNRRIKEELGVVLNHPTYKEGLADILSAAR